MLGYLRAPGKLRQELLDLVRNGEPRTWHEIHGKLPTHWKGLIGLEDEASALYDHEPLLIPGLVQTTAYARMVIHGLNEELSDAELDTLANARMSRQIVLT